MYRKTNVLKVCVHECVCYPLLLKAALSEQFHSGGTQHLLHTIAASQPGLQGARTLNTHLQREREREKYNTSDSPIFTVQIQALCSLSLATLLDLIPLNLQI